MTFFRGLPPTASRKPSPLPPPLELRFDDVRDDETVIVI